jgi:hypothetical protein
LNSIAILLCIERPRKTIKVLIHDTRLGQRCLFLVITGSALVHYIGYCEALILVITRSALVHYIGSFELQGKIGVTAEEAHHVSTVLRSWHQSI